MISHGFISGAMFLCIGVLYDRVHSRQIADYGGVVNTMPRFAALSVLFAMANCGLPGTSRLRRRVHGHPGRRAVQLLDRPALATCTLILGAAYTLWMVKRVIFGDSRAPTTCAKLDRHEQARVLHAGPCWPS